MFKFRPCFLVITVSTFWYGCSPPNAATTTSIPSIEPSDTVRLFAPRIHSTGYYEVNALFNRTRDTLVYTKVTHDFAFFTMVTSRYNGNLWSQPELMPFSGQFSDADPSYSQNGRTIYFTSRRPTARKEPGSDWDIWMTTKNNGQWSEPVNPGEPINSSSQEIHPTTTHDGTLFFSSSRDNGYDIYYSGFSNGRYQEPVKLSDSINTRGTDYDPFIDPDGRFLIYASTGHPDNLGGADLYLSLYTNNEWSRAINLGEGINSTGSDFGPMVTLDGKYLFFTSTRSPGKKRYLDQKLENYEQLADLLDGPGNGSGDIYYVNFDKVLQRFIVPD